LKAILEFNLPDDEDAFAVCVTSGTFFSALKEIDKVLKQYPEDSFLQELRSLIPHEVHEIG